MQSQALRILSSLCICILSINISYTWAERQQIALSSGWNFIALQLEPDNTRIEDILSGLNVVSVWYYDPLLAMNGTFPWHFYHSSAPAFLNSLKELHARKGYWIDMHSPGVLMIEGRLPSASIPVYPGSIPLHAGDAPIPGWNPVGFFSPSTASTVQEILEQSFSGLYEEVWGYNAATGSWVQLNSHSTLEPGKAYWLVTSRRFEITPAIEVSPTTLAFGSQGDHGVIFLRHRGNANVEWQATVHTTDGGPWLGLKTALETEEPSHILNGSAHIYKQPLYIVVDRGVLGPGEYTGSVRLISLAHPDFPIDVAVTISVEPIRGDYSGTLAINKVEGKNIPPIHTGLVASIHLEQSQVKMVIDSERSILFPKGKADSLGEFVLSGGLMNSHTSQFSVAGTLQLSQDNPLNPYRKIGKNIERQIWLETDDIASGNNLLAGTFRETIRGMLGRPIEVEGTFQLHKVGDTPSHDGSSQSGALHGQILDSDTGKPISQAIVVLTGNGITAHTETIGDGLFSFEVPDAPYQLTVQADGYLPAQTTVDSIPDATHPVVITLFPLTAAPETAYVATAYTPPLDIPDASSAQSPGAALERTLDVERHGIIEHLIVSIDLAHSAPAELLFTLVSPHNTSYTLPALVPSGQTRFSFDTDATFLGEQAAGTWALKVVEKTPGTQGILHSWSLTMTFIPPLEHISAPSPDPGIEIFFTATERQGEAPLTIQLRAMVRCEAAVQPCSLDAWEWEWDFGDPMDPDAGSGIQTSHTYTQPGAYPVTLRVTDSAGQSWEIRSEADYIRVTGDARTASGSGNVLRWFTHSLATSIEPQDAPPRLQATSYLMTTLVGAPVVGGRRYDGQRWQEVSQSGRADKILWSALLPIR